MPPSKHTPMLKGEERKKSEANKFREALEKIMPGYKWTVHKTPKGMNYLSATGTQSSGFNRLSTLAVVRRERDGNVTFEAKSAGYGLRAKWLHTHTDGTLARALRGLQEHYEHMAGTYRSHAMALQSARQAIECKTCGGTGKEAVHQICRDCEEA